MLQVLLSEHPRVATTVELTLFTRYVPAWLQTFEEEEVNHRQKGWAQGLPFCWRRDDLIGFLKDFIMQTYGRVLAQKPGATHLLDKHPANAFQIDRIRELIPRARFIHIIRDGRDVACSMVAARRTRGFGTGTIIESAAAWKRHLEAASQAAKFGPDYFEIRYEEFLRDPLAGYTRLLDFCRLPYEQSWVEQLLAANTFEKMKAARRTGDPKVQSGETHYRRGKAGSWREEMSSYDAYQFNRIAGHLLRELNYESSADWWTRSPIGDLLVRARATARRWLRRWGG
jgi:hypothetical protein